MNITSSPQEEIKFLIINYLTGSISEKDLTRLKQWINQSDNNHSYFNALKNAWILSGKKDLSDSSVKHSWTKFNDKLTWIKEQEGTCIGKRGYIIKRLRIAASWIVFLVIGSGITWLLLNKTQNNTGDAKSIEISVPLGARSTIKMPDSTIIWLNAGTTITYYENYGSETRTLNLIGEAYFDVSEDQSHPFIVQTSGIEIHALGTKFNVKAYPEEKIVSTILEEGAIQVKLPKNKRKKKNEKVLLNSNEKLIYYKEIDKTDVSSIRYLEDIMNEIKPQESPKIEFEDACVVENIQTTLYTSWKDQRWIIEGKKLGELTHLLERRYNIHIVFLDDELKNYKFSGTIENETVDQIFYAVQLTAPINFKINKDTVKLSLNKTLKEEIRRISISNN